MPEPRREKPSRAAALGGGGPSQVGVVGSMRARDASRPSEEEFAAAEQRVVIRRVPADQPFKPKKKPPAEPRTP